MHIHITWVIFQQFIRRDLKPVAFLVRIWSPSSFFESPQKDRHSIFFQRNSYTNVCLKFFYDAKLMTLLLIFTISSKSLKWKQHFHTGNFGINYFWIWLFDRAKYQEGDWTGARGTDEQPLSDMPLLIRCGGT